MITMLVLVGVLWVCTGVCVNSCIVCLLCLYASMGIILYICDRPHEKGHIHVSVGNRVFDII